MNNYKRIPKNQLVPGSILLYGNINQMYLDGIVLSIDYSKGTFLYYSVKHGVSKITFSTDGSDSVYNSSWVLC